MDAQLWITIVYGIGTLVAIFLFRREMGGGMADGLFGAVGIMLWPLFLILFLAYFMVQKFEGDMVYLHDEPERKDPCSAMKSSPHRSLDDPLLYGPRQRPVP